MRLGSLGYLMKQGWKNMAGNRLMSLASIGVLTACLIITGIATLISVNVNRVVEFFDSQNEIRVFFVEDISDEGITTLGTQISAIENVADIYFVSRQEAFEEMTVLMEDYSELMGGLENVFPPSYRVTVVDQELMEQTHAQIRTLAGVDDTYASSEMAGIIVSLRNAVNIGGWALVLLLAVVSIIVISNTIRLTVFARRREISIMKYVGATNAFIRTPFFVEGMTVGAIAGLLSCGVVSLTYHLVYGYVTGGDNVLISMMVDRLYSLDEIWKWLLLAFVAFGVVIGGLGSATSVRKHLKV